MTLYPALNDMNAFVPPAYAPGYVEPTAPAQEEAVANVQERTLRSKVARAVAIAFVAIAAIAIAGFIVAGLVVAPILFVGAIFAAVLLTAACTKTTKYHTIRFNSWRLHRPQGWISARHHEAHYAEAARRRHEARRHHEIGSGTRSAFTPPPTFVTPSGNVAAGQRAEPRHHAGAPARGIGGGRPTPAAGRPSPVAPPTHVTRDGHVVPGQRR